MMTTDKKKPGASVAARFSSSAATYDRHAGVQRAVAERVAALVRILPAPSSVLEVGCGTGILTEKLADLFPPGTVHAIDISGGMVERARGCLSRPERVAWTVGDVRTLSGAGPFDLVVSGSALHWITPVGDAFRSARRLLREDGHLVFGLMLQGTLSELHDARSRAAPHKPPHGGLPAEEAVLGALSDAGFRAVRRERETLRDVFPSAAVFLRGLHEQGVTGGAVSISETPLNRAEIEKLIGHYETRYGVDGGGVRATYEVLYVTANKERA